MPPAAVWRGRRLCAGVVRLSPRCRARDPYGTRRRVHARRDAIPLRATTAGGLTRASSRGQSPFGPTRFHRSGAAGPGLTPMRRGHAVSTAEAAPGAPPCTPCTPVPPGAARLPPSDATRYGGPAMRHATPQDLERIAPLLHDLRTLDGLTERTPGVFYRRSRAFLHFHGDPDG